MFERKKPHLYTQNKRNEQPKRKPFVLQRKGQNAGSLEKLRAGIPVQPKLNVGKSSDATETEADQKADNFIQNKGRKPESKSNHLIQRKKKTKGEDELQMKKKSANSQPVPKNVETGISSSKGKGGKLDRQTKNNLESHFGRDLSGVSIHTNDNAVQMNEQIGARAFTTGNDIYFNRGEYNPNSEKGQHLLAHEVTHTIQQGKSGARIQKKETEKQLIEKESDPVSLSEKERTELLRITGDRITMAYTNYVDAAGQVKDDIHATVQAQRDFAFFLADIALGVLLPGVSRGLAKWANNIPSSATNAEFIAAYNLLDASKTTSLLTAGTKVGMKELKNAFESASSLDKIDAFIEALKQNAQKAFDKTNMGLFDLSDMELTSVFLGFDSDLTNAATYKAQISKTVNRFKKQILTIGKETRTNTTVPQTETVRNTGVIWLEYKPKKIVLANVTLVNKTNLTRSPARENTKFRINYLVDKDLGALAERVGNQTQDNGVRMIKYSGIVQLQENGLLYNYPKSFPSNKYYKTTN